MANIFQTWWQKITSFFFNLIRRVLSRFGFFHKTEFDNLLSRMGKSSKEYTFEWRWPIYRYWNALAHQMVLKGLLDTTIVPTREDHTGKYKHYLKLMEVNYRQLKSQDKGFEETFRAGNLTTDELIKRNLQIESWVDQMVMDLLHYISVNFMAIGQGTLKANTISVNESMEVINHEGHQVTRNIHYNLTIKKQTGLLDFYEVFNYIWSGNMLSDLYGRVDLDQLKAIRAKLLAGLQGKGFEYYMIIEDNRTAIAV